MEQYLSKVSSKGQNQYLDFLIWPSFQGVNRLFVLWYVGNHTSQVIEDTVYVQSWQCYDWWMKLF